MSEKADYTCILTLGKERHMVTLMATRIPTAHAYQGLTASLAESCNPQSSACLKMLSERSSHLLEAPRESGARLGTGTASAESQASSGPGPSPSSSLPSGGAALPESSPPMISKALLSEQVWAAWDQTYLHPHQLV